MATREQVSNWISRIAPIAVEQAAKHGNQIFPSVCIAQSCCESAYGTSIKMIRANAVFGIKVGKSKAKFGTAWKGKAYSTATKECYDGKTYTNIVDMFRAYDSLDEAVEDYYDMLCTSSRYKHALNQITSKACIEGIQKAPYATSPTYVNTIMTIIDKYNLTQYDHIQRQRKLKKGCTGEDVKMLQRRLNENGYNLTVDGIYGQNTFNAIVEYQGMQNIKKDGIAGPETLKKIGLYK